MIIAGLVVLAWAWAVRPFEPVRDASAHATLPAPARTPAPSAGEHPKSAPASTSPTASAPSDATEAPVTAQAQGCMPLPGCASAELCADGCNRCRCELGSWECTRERCAGSPPCPAQPPTQFSACDREGALCGGFGPCAPICQCDGEQWRCMEQPCGAGCPAREPPQASWCDAVDRRCRYAPRRQCSCAPLSEGALGWRCSSEPG
jgi:hypothetical protein